MIPHSRKFPMRTEFLKFRRSAKRLSSPHVTCYVSRVTRPSRLSVVIPKKTNKRATTRNWLKRLTYDAVWPMVEDKNLDMVIIYKPVKLEKSDKTKKQITAELATTIQSLHNV